MSKITKKSTSRREFVKSTGRIAAASALLVLATVPALAAGEDDMRLSAENGVLEFSAKGMRLTGGRPGLTLLVGEEEKLLTWTPNATPQTASRVRQTALGYPGEDRSFSWVHPDGYALTWTICELEDGSGFTLRSKFKNGSAEKVRLHNFILCRTPRDAFVCAGDPASWCLGTTSFYNRRIGNLERVLPSEEELAHQKAYLGRVQYSTRDPRRKDGHWRAFRDVITLYTDSSQRGLTMGAVGPPVSDVRFNVRVDHGRMLLEILGTMNDVLVDPGETRESEQILVLARPYREAVQTMFRWIAETHGSRTQRGALFGWLSWYGPYTGITADIVGRVAKAVGKHRDRIPMQVIQLDDLWQVDRGDWRAHPGGFPDGMKVVADAIRQAGAIPGIWMAVMNTYAPKPKHWYQGKPRKDGAGYIDPTHPEGEKFIRESVRRMYQVGYRYYKFDFNHISGAGRLYNPKLTRVQAMRHLYGILREELGEDSYILACTGNVERCLAGFVDAVRVGSDSPRGGRWNTPPALSDQFYPGPGVVPALIRTAAQSALANGILFACDPDATFAVRETNNAHAWESYVGLLGGLNMISEPLDRTEVFSPGSRAMHMVEILNPPAPDKGWSMNGGVDPWHRQFGFVAERSWGNFASVALYNTGEEPADVVLNTTELGALGDEFHVWSFWDERYVGLGNADFAARNVPPRGVALLRLTAQPKDEDQPVLVGSSLHYSMGSAEIKEVRPSGSGITIELNPKAGAIEGKLFIYSANPLQLKGVTGARATVTPAGDRVYVVQLEQRSRGERQVLSLVSIE